MQLQSDQSFENFPFNFVDHRSQKNQKKSLPGSKLTFVQHFKALNFEEKLTKEKKNVCLSQMVKLDTHKIPKYWNSNPLHSVVLNSVEF